MAAQDILCINCGFHRQAGKRIKQLPPKTVSKGAAGKERSGDTKINWKEVDGPPPTKTWTERGLGEVILLGIIIAVLVYVSTLNVQPNTGPRRLLGLFRLLGWQNTWLLLAGLTGIAFLRGLYGMFVRGDAGLLAALTRSKDDD